MSDVEAYALGVVWVAAILEMRRRGVEARARRERVADGAERWREIHDITEALGFPPAPMTKEAR